MVIVAPPEVAATQTTTMAWSKALAAMVAGRTVHDTYTKQHQSVTIDGRVCSDNK